jgi:LysM repeat protein
MGQMGLVFTLIIMSVFFAFAFWQVQSARPNSPQLGGEKPAQAAHPIVRPTTTPSPVPLPDSNLPQALPPRPETVSSPLAATATLVIAPPTATLFPSPAPPYPTSYQVQPGDTAHHLAVWYGVETSALLAANGMQSVDQVQAGQQINIPAAVYVGPPPSYVVVKRILVDISEQHLYAYKGDALIYSFVASTGMGNSTRVGTFSVLDKIPSAYGATWDIWMPNWMGIYWSGHLENGIHALPILPGGATLWDGYLGAPISYGCVVLSSYEAQLLYDWAEVGTMVEIQW